MNSPTPASTERIQVVDALRGFAIAAILLLHNLEHFDFWYQPEGYPSWLVSLDKGIWDTMFFLFSGKAYGIFAVLFGLTFYIMQANQAKKGKDFRLRFAWRLLLLLGFGIINSAFYQGDILTIYALLGFTLIPVARLSNKAVLITACFLIFQPWEWGKFLLALSHPAQDLADQASWVYFGKMNEYITGNSFIQTVIGNLTNGKAGVYLWTWEAGRVFQTPGLFMVGMLLGRTGKFLPSPENKSFWTNMLLISSVAFVPLYLLSLGLTPENIPNEAMLRPLSLIIKSWSNIAFMTVLIAGFVLLFQHKGVQSVLNVFSVLGKMSLSNYIIQSMLGATIYYEFGLGLYRLTGASVSLIIGLALLILQWYFCRYWMRTHRYGPLEGIWHKLTWINSEK